MSILLNQEKLPAELTNMELAEEWENIGHIEEEVKEVKAIIRDEGLHRMAEQGTDGLSAGAWLIKRQRRLVVSDVNITKARALGATKMQIEVDLATMEELKKQSGALLKEATISEVVDQKVVKSILKAGGEVEGVRETEFIKVERVEKEE